eukprot:jgi/Bigna1/69868/fgenesh1_pg.10_\
MATILSPITNFFGGLIPTSFLASSSGGVVQNVVVFGVVALVAVIALNFFGVNSLFGQDISLLSDVEALFVGGGSGMGSGMATSSSGTAKAEPFIADKGQTSITNSTLAAFEPEMNDLPYKFDTYSLNEEARTFPYDGPK